jgi:hypothetical protein
VCIVTLMNTSPVEKMHGRTVPATESAADGSRLVNKKAVAKAASVSCRCVDNWMREKRIPFLKLSPRCVRFEINRVLAALRRFELKEVD